MKFLKKTIILFILGLFFIPSSISHAQYSTPGCYLSNNGIYSRVGDFGPNNTCSTGTPLGAPGNATVGVSVNNNLSYTSLEPLPGQNSQQSLNFCNLLNLLFKVLIYLGGMVAVVFLVLGGIAYMVSEVVNKKQAARERIRASLLGLLLLLVSWLILYTINPQLVTACNVITPSGPGLVLLPPPQALTSAEVQNTVQQCRSANSDNIATIIPAGGSASFTCSYLLPSCSNPLRALGGCCDVLLQPTNNSQGVSCGRATR